jgi:hypothetical protein
MDSYCNFNKNDMGKRNDDLSIYRNFWDKYKFSLEENYE